MAAFATAASQTLRRPRDARCARWTCVTRRGMLGAFAAAVPSAAGANTLQWVAPAMAAADGAERGSTVFAVLPTSVSDVTLRPEGFSAAMDDVASVDAVFLGEHHDSLVDHALQARIIEGIWERCGNKGVVVALECVQRTFQPDLDRYIAGDIDELDLYLRTEWEQRWVWPYESYLPVFRLCRKLRIPMLALSVDSASMVKVRAPGGIANLSPAELKAYIPNPVLFAKISREEGFKAYVNECITPSYAVHARMGLLEQTANFTSFYSSRVVRDEAMASQAVAYLRENPNTHIIGLIGGDHVKFEYGVPGRMQRQLMVAARADATLAASSVDEIEALPATSAPTVRSVMLNPGPTDAFDPRDSSLKLEMTAGGGPGSVVAIADYLWFSSVGDAQPRRKTKNGRLPRVEQLVLQ